MAGVLTQVATWRWFFFINVPIGIAVIVLTLTSVEESKDETFTGRIDWTGFGLITAGMVLFILALQDSGTEGWGSPLIIGSLAAGVVLLAAFAVVETRVKDPLIEFGLFRNLPFAGAAAVSFVGNWMFGSILFFLTLYLQEVLDKRPLETGLVFLTFTVPLIAMSPTSGRMVSKYGPQDLMALGEALITGGLVCFALLDASGGLGLVILGLVIAGFGQGFSFNISNSAGMDAMPDDKSGIGSGVLSFVRLMGIIVGLALSGALFKALENDALVSSFEKAANRSLTSGDKSEIRALLSGSDAAVHKLATLAPSLHTQVEDIVNGAFVHGLRGVMFLSVAACIVSIPAALWGRKRADATRRLTHLAHPLWPHLWKREPVQT